MIYLLRDIVLLICQKISDVDKVNFVLTCQKMYKLRDDITYDDKIHVDKIQHLTYFDNFTNIEISNDTLQVPKHARYVHLRTGSANIPPYVTHLTFDHMFNKRLTVPSSVTHLIFGARYNQSIESVIPNSVTHLIFGNNFNCPIETFLPTSIVHLELNHFFRQPIKHIPKSITHLRIRGAVPTFIPLSVTHLTLGLINEPNHNIMDLMVTHLTFDNFFDQSIDNCIPESVTHIMFGRNFNQPVDNLPQLITHISFGPMFNQTIDNVPMSVKEIILHIYYEREISADVTSRVKVMFKNMRS